jgi:hypothetical protein
VGGGVGAGSGSGVEAEDSRLWPLRASQNRWHLKTQEPKVCKQEAIRLSSGLQRDQI